MRKNIIGYIVVIILAFFFGTQWTKAWEKPEVGSDKIIEAIQWGSSEAESYCLEFVAKNQQKELDNLKCFNLNPPLDDKKN